MRAGFNWELGPFEMWDAAGVEIHRRPHEGARPAGEPARRSSARHPATLLVFPTARLLPAGTGKWEPVPAVPGHARIADFRRSNGVIRSNSGASLIDLGDGIACIELHSLKNAIGGDVLSLISSVLKPDSDAVRDFAGFVIASDRENFSVGANLMQLLLAAQEGEWDELAAVIHGFQQMTAAIKFCPRPVVAAPFGLTLGGGAEICLHAARRQPHAETYIGLVEAGVGLIPAGGGTKEMLLRAVDAASRSPPARPQRSAFALCSIRRDGHARSSASLKPSPWPKSPPPPPKPVRSDAPPRRPHHHEPRAPASRRQNPGSSPWPKPATPLPAAHADSRSRHGCAGHARNRRLSHGRSRLRLRARPEGRPLGRVHSRRRPRHAGTLVSEQYLLDLEREAFLSLCGERKDPGAHRPHAQNRQAAAELSMKARTLISVASLRWVLSGIHCSQAESTVAQLISPCRSSSAFTLNSLSPVKF
jgi:3-hydroxyacyl-CoA dehydrogenase